jgi:hypothetical protein
MAPLDEQDLAVEPSEISLGTVVQGVYQRGFRITNRRKLPVQIMAVSKSCDCASVDIPAVTLQPGEFIDAEVKWDIRNRSDEARSHIDVLTTRAGDDTSLTATRIQLFATVLPDYQVEPASLVMGKSKAGIAQVLVSRRQQEDFAVLDVKCNDPDLVATFSKASSTGFLVNVELKSGKEDSGRRIAELRISTNSENRPQATIPVVIN